MPPELTLRIVRIFVRDWERAVPFYTETLGLAVASRSDAFGWLQLDTGAAQLALERVAEPGDGDELVGRFLGVSLAVADVAASYARRRPSSASSSSTSSCGMRAPKVA